MDPIKRKIIFFSFIVIFFAAVPVLILDSMGYKFDVEKRKVVKTGGIFIKALPKALTVSIDGKIKGETDTFFGSILIENLVPKKYKITLAKEGYLTWEKEVEVEEGSVTDIKHIILFPQHLNFKQIAENVETFWIAPDGKGLILKEKENNYWTLKTFSLDKKLRSYLKGELDFQKGSELLNVKVDHLTEDIKLTLKIKDRIKKFNLKLKRPEYQLEEIKDRENILCKKDNMYFDVEGFLFGNIEKLNIEPLLNIKECELFLVDGSIFLVSEGNVYFLNDDIFEKKLDNVTSIVISPDAKKVLFHSENEMWLFEKGAFEFLTRFSNKIKNAAWISENYIMFLIGQELRIFEVDKKDKWQIYNLSLPPVDEFSFNRINKKIYFKQNDKIFESEPIY